MKLLWNKYMIWIRLSISVIAVLVIAFCIVLVVDGSNFTNSDVAAVILSGISIAVSVFAWLIPTSQESSGLPTLLYANKLIRENFKMGDKAAANFPYIIEPLQDIYDNAVQLLSECTNGISNKQGIIIIGEANAGKTRLAIEVIIKLFSSWRVLVWNPVYTILQIPTETTLYGKNIVVLIDDLQEYIISENVNVGNGAITLNEKTMLLQLLQNKVHESTKKMVIVATCRIEEETRVRTCLGQLFDEMTIIKLPFFSRDSSDPQVANIITTFQNYSPAYLKKEDKIKEWDGTLGSLVLGLTKKHSLYLSIHNDIAGTVLHAMYGGPYCQDKIGPIFRKTETFERVPKCYLLSTPFAV